MQIAISLTTKAWLKHMTWLSVAHPALTAHQTKAEVSQPTQQIEDQRSGSPARETPAGMSISNPTDVFARERLDINAACELWNDNRMLIKALKSVAQENSLVPHNLERLL